MNAHSPKNQKPAVGAAGVLEVSLYSTNNTETKHEGQGRNVPFCVTGLGSFDTLKDRPQEVYDLFSWADIVALVDQPTGVPKKEARWLIGSSFNGYMARQHAEQRRHGVYGVIYADIDAGNPSLADVENAVLCTIGEGVDWVIYSSSGASHDLRKWRIIVRLAAPVLGEDFKVVQNAFFDRLEQEGLICDRTLNRNGQVIFAPNVPPERRGKDGEPLFYQTVINDGVGFDFALNEAFQARLEAVYAEEQARVNKPQIDRANAAAKRAERLRLNGNNPSPVEYFNDTHDLEDLMAKYGYDQVTADDWISPNSTTRSAAVRVCNAGDRWISLSGSDYQIGRPHGMGTSGDAFDLFVAYEHGGNRDAAMQEAVAALQIMLREKTQSTSAKVGAAVSKLADEAGFDITPAYKMSPSGKVLMTLTNAMTALESLKAWRDVFAFDVFQDQAILTKGLPGLRGNPNLKKPVLMSDIHYTLAHRWFQDNGFDKMPRDAVIQAIDAHARLNEFHPVRNWFGNIRDKVIPGANLIDRWLFDGMGCKPTTETKMTYTRAVGRAWLISAVARIMEPGCQVDTVLVFEGKQGVGKSTALRHLAGDDFFRDSLPPMDQKDASAAIRGSWIIEIGELAGMNKSDVETQKAFLTRRYEMFRPAYLRLEVKYPRQCVFAASTNKSEYLRDETGGRRFWPVRAGKVNLQWIKDNRDALWAEALAAYEAGEQWHLTPEVEALASVEQAARLQEDAITPTVLYCAKALAARHDDGLISFSDLCDRVFGDNNGRTGRAEQNRVAAALVSLGAVKVGKCWARGDKLYGHIVWRPED
jgi:predicted P-loop ATPase/pimeloyl-ACP methyl ester carboxylesterase